jgi:hypothetical protein
MTRFLLLSDSCGFVDVWRSLTRGQVCRVQLLLALTRAVILGSKSRGTHDHILLSQIRDFPFCRLLRHAGIRWKYLIPTPHCLTHLITSPLYIALARTAQKPYLPLLRVISLPRKQCVHRAFPYQRLLCCHLFTQLLLGNESICRNIILPSTPLSPKRSLPSRFWARILYTFLIFLMQCTWPDQFFSFIWLS